MDVCVVVYVERTINPIQFSLASKGCFGCHQCHISWLRSPTLKIPRKSVLVMASNPLEGTHINRFRTDIPRALSVAVEQRQIEIIFMGTENGGGFGLESRELRVGSAKFGPTSKRKFHNVGQHSIYILSAIPFIY